jgi:transcription antitermination factor NusG
MFPGFTDADFDAYVPSKWGSNVYTRNRLEVKQKLLLLARDVAGVLCAADSSPLACDVSVEYPALWNHKQVDAQHLYFWRNPAARKEIDGIIDRARSIASLVEDPSPQRSHVFLAVTVTHEHVEIALKLHPDARVDRQNLERKCEDFFARDKLCALLRALPPGWLVGVSDGDMLDAVALDDDAFRRVLAAFLQPGSQWLTVARRYPRAAGAASKPEFGDAARADLEALLPIYHFIAWSRDNDFVSIRETLQREKQTKLTKGLAKNDRVQIVRGVLAGKEGVVQDFDAKGGLKVLVGKMAVKVDAQDVVKR